MVERARRWHANPENAARRRAASVTYRERGRKRARERAHQRRARPGYAEEKAIYDREYRRRHAASGSAHRSDRRAWIARCSDRARLEEYVAILRRDPCCYCGAPMEDIDHVVPRALGGEHEWDNLTAACADCNRHAKRAKSLLGFLLGHPVGSSR
jgi:5-methylcytosine-specific restriction endonuclease McrA